MFLRLGWHYIGQCQIVGLFHVQILTLNSVRISNHAAGLIAKSKNR
jgi:hypothetical protein